MRMVDLIAHKRDGGELTTGEINDFIHGYTAEDIPDYQAAALLMAKHSSSLAPMEDHGRLCDR